MKQYKFYYGFCIVELMVFIYSAIVVLKQDFVNYQFWNFYSEDQGISTEEICVPKGIYEVKIRYIMEEGSAFCYAKAQETGVRSLYSDYVKLSSLQNEKSFDIYINDDAGLVRILLEPEKEGFLVEEVSLTTTANSKVYLIFSQAVKLLVLNGIVAVIYFRKRKYKGYFEIIGIVAIGMTASLGLLEEYILYGHDIAFHLFRIEGIKEGLLAGDFPVKLQPNWFNGWGYPVSVMYGDILLYFPAALRLLGVNVQNAYKAYIVAINIATAAVSYYVFLKIAQNKSIAMFGSILYTLSPYRLCCIYIRAAVGEYSAMLFLPLVLLCFWYAFDKEEEEIPANKLLLPVIGFSGLIQTHVISCFLTAFVIVVFCLVNWKKVFNKKVIFYFIKIAGITVAVNLWFIIPFLQYMGEELMVTARAEMTPSFQKWGANFAELFAVYWNGAFDVSWGEITTIARKFPKPVGMAYLLLFLAAVIMYYRGEIRRHERKIFICMAFFLLSIAMASTSFPYYKISRIVPELARLFVKIQFPYRFLTITGIFGSLLGVLVFTEIFHNYGKKIMYLSVIFASIFVVMQGSQFIYSVLYRGDYFTAYDIETFENNTIYSGEYLYEGSWGPATEALQTPAGDGVEIGDFKKRYHTMLLDCKSEKKGAFVLMPQYYYIGYVAQDIASGEKFEIVRNDDNNRIQVNLPEGYEGTLQVSFEEPFIWRMAEGFSFIVVLGSAFCYFFRRKRAKNVALPF